MNRNTQTPASPPRFRVILVDDEPTARVHLTNRLKSHPEIEIVGEADDVTSANDLVQTLKPDLIFLDIQMPKKNGFAKASTSSNDSNISAGAIFAIWVQVDFFSRV